MTFLVVGHGGFVSLFGWRDFQPINTRQHLVGSTNLENLSHLEYLEDWITWRDQGLGVMRWSENYRALSVPYLKKYLEHFPEVSAANLETYLRGVPLTSGSKRRHIHSAVSSFASLLSYRGLISNEERELLKRLYPRRDRYNKPELKIISAEQLEILIDTATKNHHYYQGLLNATLLRFLSETGLRVSEATNLKLCDIVLAPTERAHVRVIRGKGGKNRIVPLSAAAVTAIQKYLKARPNVDFKNVFIGFNPIQGHVPLDRHCVARRFRRISKASGICFTAHSLRHFAVSTWANDPRIPLTIVQRLAGHSSLDQTEHYCHVSEAALFEAFNRIA